MAAGTTARTRRARAEKRRLARRRAIAHHVPPDTRKKNKSAVQGVHPVGSEPGPRGQVTAQSRPCSCHGRLTPRWTAPVFSPRPWFDLFLTIWQDRHDGTALIRAVGREQVLLGA